MDSSIHHRIRQICQNRYGYQLWAALLLVIVFTGVVRFRLLDVPLERDEGEHAYAGQLMLKGVMPYEQVYNMVMPGIDAAYALIMAVFGQTHGGIHLGLLVVNSLTIFVLFLLCRKLFDPVISIAAAASFGLLSLGQYVLGVFAHTEHFVILPALGGILLLICAAESRRHLSLLAGAILLGLTFAMKQQGLFFIAFGTLYLFYCEVRHRPFDWKIFLARGSLFCAGVSLPFVVVCLVLWRLGVFEKFWFWTFDYAREYVGILTFSEGLNELKSKMAQIAGSAILIWLLAGFGLVGLLWNKKLRQYRLFVTVFLVFSFLAVCPGLYFRPHYFILLLPAVALLAGIGAGCIYDVFACSRSQPMKKAVPVLLFIAAMLYTVYQQRHYFFTMSPKMVSRSTYGPNPFPESLEVSRFIRENSEKGDTIAVLGSEPQIYFYSKRASATGYIYTYPLMKDHDYSLEIQQEMIEEIEDACPEFLVFVNVPASWLDEPEPAIKLPMEKKIFKWFTEYRRKHYRQVGIVDIIGPGSTTYKWGQETAGYLPRSRYWLSVFRREAGQ